MNNNKANQIKFLDSSGVHYGILYKKDVVCGCCGQILNIKDIKILEFLPWVPIEEEIEGD